MQMLRPNKPPALAQEISNISAALLRALAVHNREKAGHCQRVARQCHVLANALNLSIPNRADIFLAAQLHDIGEIGVPSNIIHKAGLLTDAEWTEMRRHPEHAYNILSGLPAFKSASQLIYCHHEEWNGGGYPRGLKGRRIPIGARILAVVDVWDALQSARPYRAAWSRAEARRYLHEQGGAQFDPEVVAVFLEMVH